MSSSEPEHEVLAERMNAEPAIFRGCSSSELGLIVALAAALWLPVSLLLAALAGALSMAFGLAGIAIVATVILTAGLFQRIKRGRPEGFYQQRLLIALSDRGLKRSPFIRRDGHWSIGRSTGF